MKHNLGLWSGAELQRTNELKLEDSSFVHTRHESSQYHLSDMKDWSQLEQKEGLITSHNGVSQQEINIEICSWESFEGCWEWRRWSSIDDKPEVQNTEGRLAYVVKSGAYNAPESTDGRYNKEKPYEEISEEYNSEISDMKAAAHVNYDSSFDAFEELFSLPNVEQMKDVGMNMYTENTIDSEMVNGSREWSGTTENKSWNGHFIVPSESSLDTFHRKEGMRMDLPMGDISTDNNNDNDSKVDVHNPSSVIARVDSSMEEYQPMIQENDDIETAMAGTNRSSSPATDDIEQLQLVHVLIIKCIEILLTKNIADDGCEVQLENKFILTSQYPNKSFNESAIYDDFHRKTYVKSLKWDSCPQSMRDDWHWYTSAYKKHQLDQFEGKYVLIANKMVLEGGTCFDSAAQAAEYLEERDLAAIVIHVGPEGDVASLFSAHSTLSYNAAPVARWDKPTVSILKQVQSG